MQKVKQRPTQSLKAKEKTNAETRFRTNWARAMTNKGNRRRRAEPPRCLKRASKNKPLSAVKTNAPLSRLGRARRRTVGLAAQNGTGPIASPNTRLPTPGRRLAARSFANARPNARKVSAGQKNGCEGGGGGKKARRARGREGKRRIFHFPFFPAPARAKRRNRANRLPAA